MLQRNRAQTVLEQSPFENRKRARERKREAVLHAALQLFLEEGYHRTKLTDVADRLSITKTALYNYFESKQEILLECYRLGQERMDASIEQIDGTAPGIEKLRAYIAAYATVMTNELGMCLVRLDDKELEPEARQNIRNVLRRYDEYFRQFIRDGIADGSIYPCDPKLVAFTIAGALNWIGHWYKPQGSASPDALALTMSHVLTDGIAAVRN